MGTSCLEAIAARTEGNLFLNENNLAAVGSAPTAVRMLVVDCIVNDKNPETSMKKKLIRQPLQKYGAIELQVPNVDDIGMEKSGPSLDSYGMLELTIYCSSILIGRENEVQEAWPFVHWFLNGYGISSTLNITERCLTISTTRRTMYPDIIDQAGNFLELLARTSIPATKAADILNGRLEYEVIKIGFQAGGLCAKYETEEEHAKNRERLKRNSKAVAGLLKCDIYINGCSAVAVGTEAVQVNFGLLLNEKRRSFSCCKEIKAGSLAVPIDEENSSFVLVNVNSCVHTILHLFNSNIVLAL